MNLSTITRPLALIAVGALALTGCAAAEPESEPAETIYVEVEAEPEPEPEVEIEPVTEDLDMDEINRLAFQMVWAENTATQKADLCTGLNLLGPEATAVVIASDVPADDEDFDADIFVEEMAAACESEGLL